MAHLIPLHDYLLIRHDPEPKSLVVRPDKAEKDFSPVVATVIAVGEMVNVRGEEREMKVGDEQFLSASDRVLVDNRHVGTPIKAEGEEGLVMLHDRNVMAVVR